MRPYECTTCGKAYKIIEGGVAALRPGAVGKLPSAGEHFRPEIPRLAAKPIRERLLFTEPRVLDNRRPAPE